MKVQHRLLNPGVKVHLSDDKRGQHGARGSHINEAYISIDVFLGELCAILYPPPLNIHMPIL